MNKSRIKIFLFVSAFSLSSWAQEGQAPEFTAEIGNSVNESAGITSGQNGMGQAMSMIQGGMHISTGKKYLSKCGPDCGSCCAKGAMNIALGLLSLAQGKAHGKAAKAADFTGYQTDGTGTYNPATVDPNTSAEGGPLASDPSFRAAMNDLKSLRDSGVINDKNDSIKTQMGNYKVSDFKSASSMKAAGIPKGAIDGGLEFAKKLSQAAEDKAKKLKLGALTDSSGYNEGGGGLKQELSSSTSEFSSSAISNRAVLSRDPSNLAGMQKNYNGEPIGVSGDSIFLMMNRRYKVKESQDSFFNESDLRLQK